MNYSIEDLRELQVRLNGLLLGDISSPSYGICKNLQQFGGKIVPAAVFNYYKFVEKHSIGWPLHTGFDWYPVPVSVENVSSKWDNPYRINLVRFLLDKVNKAVADIKG